MQQSPTTVSLYSSCTSRKLRAWGFAIFFSEEFPLILVSLEGLVVEVELGLALHMADQLTVPELSLKVSLVWDDSFLAHETFHRLLLSGVLFRSRNALQHFRDHEERTPS